MFSFFQCLLLLPYKMAKKKGTRKKPNLKQPIAKPPNPLITTCGADVSAATATTIAVNPPVLWKVCRLCETKDGPFLNIFDADKVIAKKIEELLPFGVSTPVVLRSFAIQ